MSLSLLQEFGREAVENENKNVHHSSHHAKEKRTNTKIEVWHFIFLAYSAPTVLATHIDFMLNLSDLTIILNRYMIRLIGH